MEIPFCRGVVVRVYIGIVVWPSRQAIAILSVLALGVSSILVLTVRAASRITEAGFWFEDVKYFDHDAVLARLGGPLGPDEIKTIESVARSEITDAFKGLRVTFSDRRDTSYRVQVVTTLRDFRFKREVESVAQSRAIAGFGAGAVNFRLITSYALGYASPDADRAAVIASIGRGIGRAAVHEFAHQFLPKAPIHDSHDVQSYEYAFAYRREQYYGPMRWNLAWPLLHRRLGPAR